MRGRQAALVWMGMLAATWVAFVFAPDFFNMMFVLLSITLVTVIPVREAFFAGHTCNIQAPGLSLPIHKTEPVDEVTIEGLPEESPARKNNVYELYGTSWWQSGGGKNGYLVAPRQFCDVVPGGVRVNADLDCYRDERKAGSGEFTYDELPAEILYAVRNLDSFPKTGDAPIWYSPYPFPRQKADLEEPDLSPVVQKINKEKNAWKKAYDEILNAWRRKSETDRHIKDTYERRYLRPREEEE